MEARIQAILLAVEDLAQATTFYEALGFKKDRGGAESAIYSLGETQLVLATGSLLTGVTGQDLGTPGVQHRTMLAQMVRSQEAVDQIVAEAEKAGATIVKATGSNDWGGYNGVFADPDGHVWNVSFNLLFYRA